MHARPSSAVVILEDDQERAILVKAHYKAHWTFPGGMVDAGETPKQAAMREVAEEIGLTLEAEAIAFAWMATRRSEVADTYQFIFRTTLPPVATDTIVLQASEIAAWKWVSKADILSGDVPYAQAAILWARNNTEPYVEQQFGVTT
jgi:8-oxo-dGTP pyrophosphatase MutT (NUDIX family)